jgi:hypothetical protein
MVKTPTELRVYAASGQLQGEAYRAEGAATFAFTQAGAPAFAWLPGSGVLLHWNGSQFDIVPVSAAIQGDVIALAAPGPATAALLVNRAGVLWRMDIATPGGAIAFEAPMPGVTAPALLLNDGTVIYAADGAPVVRAPSGQQRRTAIAGRVTGFSLLGPDWIRIDGDSPARTYALRLSSGALFVLPEVSR